MAATTIKTRFSIGETVRWVDNSDQRRAEAVLLIKTLCVEPFGLWVLYGYGDKYNPRWVSEHRILVSEKADKPKSLNQT